MSAERTNRALLVVAWAAVAGATALLAWRLPSLPDVVPAYRGPDGAVLVEKGALVVLRVPLIGAAMLAVVTVMFRRTWAKDGWRWLWRAASIAIAVKTIAEAIELALFGTAHAALRGGAFATTIVAVAAFVVAALVLWRKGALSLAPGGSWRDFPAVDKVTVVVAGVVWLALASLPVWLRGA